MTNLQNRKAQLEMEIAKLQNELAEVKAQIVAEENTTIKKGKLTDKQSKFIEGLKRASYLYLDETGKAIDSHTLYINGELANYDTEGNVLVRKSEATRIGQNSFTLQGHTATLKSLEKKGYINIDFIGGDAYDVISLVDAPPEDEVLTKLEEIKLQATYYNDFLGKEITSNQTVYCKVGQSEISLEAFQKRNKMEYTVQSTNVIKVTAWK